MSDSSAMQERRDWYVFETIVADGTWAIGIAQGEPSPNHVMVAADRLTRAEALRLARQRADECDRAGADVREAN